jgi:D-Tyr-tRNAtyr deacylase
LSSGQHTFGLYGVDMVVPRLNDGPVTFRLRVRPAS